MTNLVNQDHPSQAGDGTAWGPVGNKKKRNRKIGQKRLHMVVEKSLFAPWVCNVGGDRIHPGPHHVPAWNNATARSQEQALPGHQTHKELDLTQKWDVRVHA